MQHLSIWESQIFERPGLIEQIGIRFSARCPHRIFASKARRRWRAFCISNRFQILWEKKLNYQEVFFLTRLCFLFCARQPLLASQKLIYIFSSFKSAKSSSLLQVKELAALYRNQWCPGQESKELKLSGWCLEKNPLHIFWHSQFN